MHRLLFKGKFVFWVWASKAALLVRQTSAKCVVREHQRQGHSIKSVQTPTVLATPN